MMKMNGNKAEAPTGDGKLTSKRATESGTALPRLHPIAHEYPSGCENHPAEHGDKTRGGSNKVLDIGDIANLFHCSREKIKRMARSGELPAFKFGKGWYVLREDLERLLSDKVESSRHLRRIQEVSP